MGKVSPLLTGGMISIGAGVFNLTRAKGPATFTLSIIFIVLGLALLTIHWFRSSRG